MGWNTVEKWRCCNFLSVYLNALYLEKKCIDTLKKCNVSKKRQELLSYWSNAVWYIQIYSTSLIWFWYHVFKRIGIVTFWYSTNLFSENTNVFKVLLGENILIKANSLYFKVTVSKFQLRKSSHSSINMSQTCKFSINLPICINFVTLMFELCHINVGNGNNQEIHNCCNQVFIPNVLKVTRL